MTVFEAPSHYNHDENLSLVVTEQEDYVTFNVVHDHSYGDHLSLNLTKDQVAELVKALQQML